MDCCSCWGAQEHTIWQHLCKTERAVWVPHQASDPRESPPTLPCPTSCGGAQAPTSLVSDTFSLRKRDPCPWWPVLGMTACGSLETAVHSTYGAADQQTGSDRLSEQLVVPEADQTPGGI